MTTDDGDRDLVEVMREYIAAREFALFALADVRERHVQRIAGKNEHAAFHQVVELELRDVGCR